MNISLHERSIISNATKEAPIEDEGIAEENEQQEEVEDTGVVVTVNTTINCRLH